MKEQLAEYEEAEDSEGGSRLWAWMKSWKWYLTAGALLILVVVAALFAVYAPPTDSEPGTGECADWVRTGRGRAPSDWTLTYAHRLCVRGGHVTLVQRQSGAYRGTLTWMIKTETDACRATSRRSRPARMQLDFHIRRDRRSTRSLLTDFSRQGNRAGDFAAARIVEFVELHEIDMRLPFAYPESPSRHSLGHSDSAPQRFL